MKNCRCLAKTKILNDLTVRLFKCIEKSIVKTYQQYCIHIRIEIEEYLKYRVSVLSLAKLRVSCIGIAKLKFGGSRQSLQIPNHTMVVPCNSTSFCCKYRLIFLFVFAAFCLFSERRYLGLYTSAKIS